MTNDHSSDVVTSVNTDAAVRIPHDEQTAPSPVSFCRRLRRAFWHAYARLFTLGWVILLSIAKVIGRRRRPISSQGCNILLTGRFDSANWIRNHLGPLAASEGCAHVWMVSTNPVPVVPKVTPIYPRKWMVKVMGATQARLLTFAWAALCRKPDWVGGFYLVANGIVAALVARLVAAQSMYFCVGGPAEVLDGGCHSKDNITGRMETPDVVVESRLLKIVGTFDTVITMGTRARGPSFATRQSRPISVSFRAVSINRVDFSRAKTTPSAGGSDSDGSSCSNQTDRHFPSGRGMVSAGESRVSGQSSWAMARLCDALRSLAANLDVGR